MKLENNDKDILISQLKAQIFELEQNEKNFQGLNQKFRSLQNEYDPYINIDSPFLMKKSLN